MMLELEITELGASGDGIGFLEGNQYYVPFTMPGDHVQIENPEKRGNGFLATLVNILTPSSNRSTPKCRHFGTCGGCSLQHIGDAELADWKQARVESTLQKAGIVNTLVNPTITSPENSRRRVEFVAAKRKKGVMIGYHLRRSKQIFDVGECPLIKQQILALVKPLRAMLPTVMPRNSKARLTITDTTNGLDLLITANFSIDLEAREILANFAQTNKLCRICWYDEEEKLLEQVSAIRPAEIAIGSKQGLIPPGGFLQATLEGQEALIRLALEALPSGAKILDLFSGCGSFSLPAAHQAKAVRAIEGDEELIFALQNAANKYMLPITTETRDLFRNPLIPDELNKFDAIIIDPPRAGATAQVEEIASCNVQHVVFISCNPVSYARDVKLLTDNGYELKEVTPIDQFRWSSHVELFSVLEKT